MFAAIVVARSREEEMKNLLRLSNFVVLYFYFYFFATTKTHFFHSRVFLVAFHRLLFLRVYVRTLPHAIYQTRALEPWKSRPNEWIRWKICLSSSTVGRSAVAAFFFVEWSSTTRARIATKAARLSSCLTQIKTLHKLQFFVVFFRCLWCCSKSTNKPPPPPSSPLNFLFHFILFIYVIAPPSYTTFLYTLGRLWLRLRRRRRKVSWRKEK